MEQQISQGRPFVKSIRHIEVMGGLLGVEVFFAGRQKVLENNAIKEILSELFTTELEMGTYGLIEGIAGTENGIEVTFVMGTYQMKDELDPQERFIVMADRTAYWNHPHLIKYFDQGDCTDRRSVPWAAFFHVLGKVLKRPYYPFEAVEKVLGNHHVIHPKQVGYH